MIVTSKLPPSTAHDATLMALRSRSTPLLTKPGGRVPLQVIISSTPLLLSAPPMCSCALPSRRRVPPFVALPVMMSEPPRHSQTPRLVSDAQLTVPPWLDRTAPDQIVR